MSSTPSRCRPDIPHLAADNRDLRTAVGARRPAGDREFRDGADRGQGLAAKAERADVEQGFVELRRAMPANGEGEILRPHAAAIVDHAQKRLAAAGRRHLDPGGACVDRILDQFLRRTGWPFDDLAGGDLVDEGLGELLDDHTAIFPDSELRRKTKSYRGGRHAHH